MFCQELASPPAISDSKFDPINLDHLKLRSGLGFKFLGNFLFGSRPTCVSSPGD